MSISIANLIFYFPAPVILALLLNEIRCAPFKKLPRHGVYTYIPHFISIEIAASLTYQLYEAAEVDGAGRWKKMWHVSLPTIRSTVVIMLILRVGSVLNTGYEQIFLMQNSMNRSVSKVFDTYIYTRGVVNGSYSVATAAGMFKPVVSMILVLGANRLAKIFGESGFY